MSPPTRFGEVYRQELAVAANVETYLYGNVVDIETNDTASSVSRVRVACLDGDTFRVKAKIFVLATGGIENPRLLLLANKVQAAGLGNTHDAVGRFYMNHPRLDAAWIMLNEASSPALRPVSSVGKIVTRLKVSERTAAAEGLARFAAWIYPAEASGKRPQSEGYKSLRWVVRLIRNGQLSTEILTHLRRVAADLDGVVTDVIAKYSDQPLISIEPEYEQVPNPYSRVMLGEDRDALGLNRVQVDWQFTELDKFSLRRSLEIIGEEVGRTGVGRLRIDDWVMSDDLSSFPGEDRWHPAGTTRMSENPKTGVVDRNCRVHGIDNLYVAGSSVFPTIGFANPTLTIVAMTLRLGDHVKTAAA
jgi:choline dehydrogenase-like flavoprotein